MGTKGAKRVQGDVIHASELAAKSRYSHFRLPCRVYITISSERHSGRLKQRDQRIKVQIPFQCKRERNSRAWQRRFQDISLHLRDDHNHFLTGAGEKEQPDTPFCLANASHHFDACIRAKYNFANRGG